MLMSPRAERVMRRGHRLCTADQLNFIFALLPLRVTTTQVCVRPLVSRLFPSKLLDKSTPIHCNFKEDDKEKTYRIKTDTLKTEENKHILTCSLCIYKIDENGTAA